MAKKNTREASHAWRHILIWALIFFALFPIYVVITSSLNNSGGLSTSSLIPSKISFDNYKSLFNDPSIPFGRWILNSIILAGLNAAISVMVGIAAAYAFSRLKFKGRK